MFGQSCTSWISVFSAPWPTLIHLLSGLANRWILTQSVLSFVQSIDDFMLPLPVCDQPIEEAYTIESVIGDGSYSTVHTARSRYALDIERVMHWPCRVKASTCLGVSECRSSGECVVVKAVRLDTLDPDERQGALQEAQTLSHLRHTNIIRYHDVRYSEGMHLQLSESCSSGTWHTLCSSLGSVSA